MKLQFVLIMKGEDNIEKKLEEAIKSHPNIHMDLIRAFSNAIMMSLRLTEKDNISIESFKAGKVIEENKPVSEDAKNWGKPGSYVSGS